MKLSTNDRIKILNCITSRVCYLDQVIKDMSLSDASVFQKEQNELMILLARMEEWGWCFEQEGNEE